MFPTDKQNLTLQLSHVFPGNRERVFQAWTKKEELELWFGPEGYATTVKHLEVTLGGTYQFELRRPDGNVAGLSGTYWEIIPNEKLVFTWRWADWGKEVEDTIVTVQFLDKGNDTEILLTHRNFASQQALEGHKFSWSSILGSSFQKYIC